MCLALRRGSAYNGGVKENRAIMMVVVVLVIAVGAAWVLARGRSAPQPAPPLPPARSARNVAPPPAAPEPTPADLASVPRIPATELAQKLGSVTVIDVRDADAYIAGHVAGAKHIPLQYLPGEVSYLPKDKPIVTYCT